jgi:hypothetical protein
MDTYQFAAVVCDWCRESKVIWASDKPDWDRLHVHTDEQEGGE